MKKKRSRLESETTITFNAADDCALVGSCYEPFKNRMKKRNAEVYRHDGEWITWKVPKSWIKVSPKRQVSAETRKKMSDNFAKINSLVKIPESCLDKTT